MSLGSVTERAPAPTPSTAKWIAWTVVALVTWAAVYSQLVPFSDWVVALTQVDPTSHLGEAVSFFVYDTPKVLMLLTLVVFAMGVVRSFFSPERTRALARRQARGRRQRARRRALASSRRSAPARRCRCSSAFVSAGVPLGVTFSFLIAAPMINEVALGLLFGLVGWKVALTYLGFGLGVAIVAGWVIGRLHLEHWLEEWVRTIRTTAADFGAEQLHRRATASRRASRRSEDIVGKVWLWIIVGIAVGAFIHGYVPADLLACDHGPAMPGGRCRPRCCSAFRCIRTPPGSSRWSRRCSAKVRRSAPCWPS